MPADGAILRGMADVALLRTALGDLAAVLDAVTDDESREPSGCRGWSVLDLAYHLVEDAHRTLVDLNSPADGPADTDDVEARRTRPRGSPGAPAARRRTRARTPRSPPGSGSASAISPAGTGRPARRCWW